MGRLIDADVFVENIASIADLRTLSTKAIGEALDKTPTVDAVPVVLCKDCIRYLQQDEVWGRCTITPYLLRKKDFCSYGVQKGGE